MHDLWRGAANAWECDELGHLNVRFYLAKANEALAHLAARIGLSNGENAKAAALLAPVDVRVRYLAEARPGAPLAIAGGVADLTEDALTACLVMRHALSGAPAASIVIRAVHADRRRTRVYPFSSAIREAAEALRIETPPEAAPRSISTGSVEPEATLARAEALGLAEIGRGVFLASDADAARFVRFDTFIGRISDSIAGYLFHVLPPPEESRVAGALLEARLAIRATPRAGDAYVIRSAITGIEGKTMRLVHWILDPISGAPWATSEGVPAFFDLEARKAVTPPDAVRTRIEAVLKPDVRV